MFLHDLRLLNNFNNVTQLKTHSSNSLAIVEYIMQSNILIRF